MSRVAAGIAGDAATAYWKFRRRHDELRRRRRELGTSGSRERRLRGVELITQQGDRLAVIGDFRAELRDRGVPRVHRAAVRASRSALQRAEGGG